MLRGRRLTIWLSVALVLVGVGALLFDDLDPLRGESAVGVVCFVAGLAALVAARVANGR